MGFGLRMVMAHRYECVVCRGEHSWTERDQSRIKVELFGAAKFTRCINCKMEVGEDTFKDRNYRRRWRASQGRREKATDSTTRISS